MSKIPKVKKLKATKKVKSVPKIDSPYLAAQQVWNERYGDYIKSRNSWRMIALASMALAVPAVAFSLIQSGKTKVIPYVIEVDRLGNAVGGAPVNSVPYKAENVIKSTLSTFIKNFRGVTVDSYLQRQRIDELYSFLPAQSKASAKVSAYMSGEGNPFEIAQNKTVAINIVTMVRLTDESYRAEWIETDYDRGGIVGTVQRWQAILTFDVVPPVGAAIINNPLGIYVRDIEWEKEAD